LTKHCDIQAKWLGIIWDLVMFQVGSSYKFRHPPPMSITNMTTIKTFIARINSNIAKKSISRCGENSNI